MTLLLFVAPAAAAALIAYALVPPSRRLALAIGAVDRPDARKIHSTPIARLGGLPVIIAVVAVIVAELLMPWVHFRLLPRDVLAALALGLAPIVIVSILDDIQSRRAVIKFAAHLAGAAIAVAMGIRLNDTVHLIGHEMHIGWLAIPISILWLAGVTNAFNLIDGLDGLSAGLALISAASLVAVSLVTKQFGMAATAAILGGAVIGFLPYNLYPARVYLGDSGATAIGFILGALTLRGGSTTSAGLAVVLPIVVLGIPLADTLIAMIRRVVRRIEGASSGVFDADRNHIHHRLLALGYRHERAVMLLYLVGIVLSVLAFASVFMTHQNAALLLGTLLAAAVVGVSKLGYDEFAVVKKGFILRFYDAPVLKQGLFIVFADLTMIATALYLAVGLKYDDWGVTTQRTMVLAIVPLLTAVTLMTFAIMNIYRHAWSNVNVDDVIRLSTAITLSTIGTYLIARFTLETAPTVTFMVTYTLVMMAIVNGSRASYRVLMHWNRRSNRDGEPVVIYGAGKAGTLALREILSNSAVPMRPVGFIDDDPRMRGRLVNGYPVLGDLAELANVVLDGKTRGLVIASEKIPIAKIESARRLCASAGAWTRVFRIGFLAPDDYDSRFDDTLQRREALRFRKA
jgi:UDP-GlcNAc:undecaprenyl-phosphate/decaprenyl-phosphate GlcNAc-1-phosphate transferase